MQQSKTIINSGRVDYIDIAKCLGMFLVLLGHTVASDTITKNIVYSFHMPLFFLLSGMVLHEDARVGKCEWTAYAKSKFYGVMLPCFIWGGIYSAFSWKNVLFILYGTRETLMGAGSLSSLWFFPVWVLACLATDVLISISGRQKRKQTIILIIGMVALTCIGFLLPHNEKYGDPWGIDIAFVAASFVILGFLIRKCFIKLSMSSLTLKLFVSAITLLVFLFTVQFSDSDVGYVLMANGFYGNVLIFLLNAVLGSCFAISVAILISGLNCSKRILLYIGRNTFGIFLIHKPIVELGRAIANKINLDYNNIFVAGLISLVGFGLSTAGVWIIEKVFPEIIGKKRRQQYA